MKYLFGTNKEGMLYNYSYGVQEIYQLCPGPTSGTINAVHDGFHSGVHFIPV